MNFNEIKRLLEVSSNVLAKNLEELFMRTLQEG
jgi:DNA-binding HxlR family transcriptional regulator